MYEKKNQRNTNREIVDGLVSEKKMDSDHRQAASRGLTLEVSKHFLGQMYCDRCSCSHLQMQVSKQSKHGHFLLV